MGENKIRDTIVMVLTGWGIFTCYDDTDSITVGIGDNPSLSEDVIFLVLTGLVRERMVGCADDAEEAVEVVVEEGLTTKVTGLLASEI